MRCGGHAAGSVFTRFIVGANMGWTSNVNYTIWAHDKHFYLGDWLCMLSLLPLSSQIYSFLLPFLEVQVMLVSLEYLVVVYKMNPMHWAQNV